MPAMRFTAGLSILYSHFGQKCARYAAVKTPIGTPMTSAPAVTYKLPTIMGNIPYRSLEGAQVVPKRKSRTPIFPMAGKPPANRKKQMRTTEMIEKVAVKMNTHFIKVSFKVLLFKGTTPLFSPKCRTALLPDIFWHQDYLETSDQAFAFPVKIFLTCSFVRFVLQGIFKRLFT